MKSIIKYWYVVCIIGAAMACNELDNYDAPTKKLTGRIVYNGQPINVERGQVRIQLWESGWELKTPIDVAIAQDGTFSALLFNGDYKMVIPKGQGPFMAQSDTILLELRGSREVDVEVVPYYLIHDVAFSSSNGDVSANFSIEKIINDANAKDIEWVGLFVNPTQFASAGTNENDGEAKVIGGDITDPTTVEITANVKQLVPAQNYVYATIGLKIAGVEDLIYSPVQKVNF